MPAFPDRRRLPAASLLSLAMLAAFAAPARADDPCLNPDGTPVSPAPSTDQGNEDGDNNTTCWATASAYGGLNNASGEQSSAFGYANVASGLQSSAVGNDNDATAPYANAFGRANIASGYGSSAFGHGNRTSGIQSAAFGLGNRATAFASTALGHRSVASGEGSVAVSGWLDRDGNGIPTLDLDLDGDGINEASSETSRATGASAVALGAGVAAIGIASTAVGVGNIASGERGVAIGHGNDSGWGSDSIAIGTRNQSELSNSITLGSNNHAISGTAIGAYNFADEGALAVGSDNNATVSTVAFGRANTVSGSGSGAFGWINDATGDASAAFGGYNTASGVDANAFGTGNTASGSASTAFGYGNTASGAGSSAFGLGTVASGESSSAFGAASQALNLGSTAIGYQAIADRDYAVSVGSSTRQSQIIHVADGTQATDAVNLRQLNAAIAGVTAGTSNPYFVADGANDGSDNAVVTGDNAVAIGANSVADEDDTVAVGDRRITDVGDAEDAQDAVNLRQLTSATDTLGGGFANWIGGGASYAGGTFVAPSFSIQGTSYHNVGDAFAAVDNRLTALGEGGGGVGPQGPAGASAYQVAVANGYTGTETQWLASLVGSQGPTGPTGPQGPAGDGTGGMTETQVQTLVDDGDAETLEAANTHTDTVATETLESANTYTDTRITEILGFADSLDSFRNDVNDRFEHMDRRIDRMAAMSGAYAGMAMNTAGLPGRNRIGVGFGSQGGEQALAVGYQRIVGKRASVSIGGAFGGGEKSVMGGAGFSW